MNRIDDAIKSLGKDLYVEESWMSAAKNAILLKNFGALNKHDGAVLLGVCGGRNSEGEDFPGDLMNSVIIVGIPYLFPSAHVNAKIKYYNNVFNDQGWLFAYLYPAMQRANQASGRPIRKEGDKGVIIFLDSRYKKNVAWISDWIRREIEVVPDRKNAISQKLREFWSFRNPY